ncbi:alpha/beta hydrolase [Parasphingopyxis marina]|uniref:Alpha/beta hydrolase n=1 Tax=Parasphingopyxis marina TaxID=2761622 RepID=A0A842HUE8_9SPHN|nr:alpha/beta hydrolase [Parasphingopyxis marina]MBC2776011.1 alpha/beta hydrolase [Parasphingopyxis marina]
MLPKAIRNQIEALGPDLNPDMMHGTQGLIAGLHGEPDPATKIVRDLAYGPDERHKVDIFAKDGAADAPVLVFVHGGGFVMGDKRSEGTPFYDNIGQFAAANGWIGATITYRLAPANPWPAGPEDLATLVGWLRANIADHGGNPDKIFLMGQSAGAVHVASYAALSRFHGADGAGIAGALMISCIYDVEAAHANQFHIAYYGEDKAAYAECSTVEGLIEADIPFLASVSEFDIEDFQKQAADFVGRYGKARGAYPRMLYLEGHNHLSPALAVGSSADSLGPEIRAFVEAHS